METNDQSRIPPAKDRLEYHRLTGEMLCAARTCSTLFSHLHSNVASFPMYILFSACNNLRKNEFPFFWFHLDQPALKDVSPKILNERPDAKQEFNGCETNFACSVGRRVAREQLPFISLQQVWGRPWETRVGERPAAFNLALGPDPRETSPRLVSNLPSDGE